MRTLVNRLTWKSLLIFLIILAAMGGIAYASYRILRIEGTVTVEEAITLEEPPTFTLTLYPNESVTRTFHLKNAGSAAIDVHLDVEVSPKDKGLGASVNPNPVSVPGQGSASFTVTMVADSDAEPREFTVKIDVAR